MKALLIKQPWIDLILDGKKMWELRGSNTRIREEIALVESGTGTVVGTCKLTGTVGPLTLAQIKRTWTRHGAPLTPQSAERFEQLDQRLGIAPAVRQETGA